MARPFGAGRLNQLAGFLGTAQVLVRGLIPDFGSHQLQPLLTGARALNTLWRIPHASGSWRSFVA
jgi:hypothetical protein